ncbi:RHS repeat protein, partial [Winkia neuii]|uniref:RHS repeat protein n=1 Tax=Winkia neuii TaxID=33007 RepID=UPI0025537C8A
MDFAYDQAGQLVSTSTTTSQGKVDTAYRYDQQGRRISQRSSNGDVRSYSWDYLGRLVGVSANGETTAIGFDVFGRPERIGENKLDWGQSALGLGGPNICAGSSWDAGRVWVSPYRSVDPAAPFVPDGTGIDGLFFMGARVYDAHTQCFLSPDPLPAAPGSMWQGNPYDYAGANPLSLSDPLGLKPITDAQMRALATYNHNRHTSAGHWVTHHWEYLAAGVAIGVGVGLAFSGVGSLVGVAMLSGALISGGVSAGTQKYYNGKVDIVQTLRDAALGAVTTGAATGVGNVVKTAILNRSSTAAEALANMSARPGTEFANDTVWSAVNNTTARAQALKELAVRDSDAAFEYFTTNLAG